MLENSTEQGMKIKKKSALEFEFNIGKVNLTQKAFFSKNLAVMLASGLGIVEALDISVDSTKGKFKTILQGVAKSVESGRSLSDGFKMYPKVFPAFFISAVYAGEESGTLEENLNQVAIQFKKEKELVDKIKGAMIYPAVILVAGLILSFFVAFFILPKILPLFEGFGVELPFTTRVLISFSHFMDEYKAFIPWFLIGSFFFLNWLLRQKFTFPVTHKILLSFPVVKTISRGVNLARFSRTLGTLLMSGLNIDEALDITGNAVGNYYYKQSIMSTSVRIQKGSLLSECLDKYESLYPRITSRMIRVGEESGKLDETLMYIAEFYEEEVDNATKSLSVALEPILLVVIGFAVGFLALAIITPIYNITGSISG
ncbi:type II secretion system F family protein [Patescibacteria group bacterium]|nr:type II secretion system F family protein [Patescibacteria group bacterium]